MTKTTPAFQQAYQQLNSAQKKAVDSIQGPVLVIAGPGTGKTQIIATRIANILLKTDTDPSAILALTFTDSAAANMRDRLIQLIGQPAYRIHISTFHSFCDQVIKEYPDYFTIAPQAQILTDLERFQIIHSILDQTDFQILKPTNSPYYYTRSIVSALKDLKREAVLPSHFQQILRSQLQTLEAQKEELSKTKFNRRTRQLNKNLELVKIYHQYQKELQKRGRYDFADMINFVLQKFQQKPALLTEFQERFHYLLVDEYQDTTSAQNQVVNQLASYWGSQANLFVVGDDQQSIFRFAGASLENPLEFKDRYPKAKVITLQENYRSQQTILDAAHQLIDHNQFDLKNSFPDLNRHLTSKLDLPDQPLNLVNLDHQLIEQDYMATSVKKLIKQNTPPNQIAIITRNNAELILLSKILRYHQVPFAFQGSQNVLNSLTVNYLIKLFTLIKKSTQALDDLDFFTVLHYPFLNFNSLDILKLSRHAHQHKTTLIDTIMQKDFSDKNIVKEPQKFIDFLSRLHNWQQLNSQTTFTNFAQTVLKQSGLLQWVLNQSHTNQHLTNLKALFTLVEELNHAQHDLDLDQFLDYLNLMRQNNLIISQPDLSQAQNQITLTTAHKAKGLEWDHVFIYQAVDGHWGNQYTRQLIKLPPQILKKGQAIEHDPIEDERRLFYVALTRAKKTLTITYSDTYHKNGRPRQAVPSQFVTEIPKKFFKTTSPKPDQDHLNQLLTKLVSPPIPSQVDDQQAQYLNNLLKDFQFSATALNNYLKCPYLFKLNNLLKVPRAKPPHLVFGTAVHQALEKFYSCLQSQQKPPSKKFLIDQFETALRREVLEEKELQSRLKHGRQVLSAYYHQHQDSFSPAHMVEKYFGGLRSPVMLDDIPLSGKIDRIDLVSSNPKTIKVIDYKTGKRKTRGQIKGTTKNSHGDLNRQLIFYQLLINLDKTLSAKVQYTQLDFVETPHRENKPGIENFIIKKQQIEKLKKTIHQTIRQIRQLNFSRTQDKSHCPRCDFKDHCWPQGIPQANS